MLLIPVRHGETEWNVLQREIGQLDSRLTAHGERQAEALGHRLSGIPFHALYSSDLGRAVQTAQIIAALCQNKQVQLDSGLRERHMGLFQGLTLAEMDAKYPQAREEYQRNGFYATVPGGESAQQRVDRSARVLTAIAERHPDETVVVVTHSGILTGFLEYVLGIPFGNGPRFKKQNASFNTFEYADSKWCLQTWNDLSHLEKIGSLDDSTTQEV